MNNYEVTMIETKNLSAHPDNPRKEIGDLSELTESIKEKGILQPLIVVPWFSTLTREPAEDDSMTGIYTIVAGHRRHAAAKLAGLEELPCIITDMDQHEQIETMLLENIQRSDLTYLEQAEGFQMMIDLGTTVDELSERTGFAKSTIYHRIKILELDDEVKANDQIRMNDYVAAEVIEDVEERNKFLQEYGGSKDFDSELKRAKRTQEILKVKNRIKEMLSDLGAEEKFKNAWESDFKTIETFDYTDNDVISKVEQLSSDDVKGLFYCEGNYGFNIRLYKIEDCKEIKDKPVKVSPEEEEENRRKREIDGLTDDLKARIEEHIKLIADTEPRIMEENREEFMKHALKFFMLDRTMIDTEPIEKLLGTYDLDDEASKKAIDKFIEEKSTEQIMLVETISVFGWWDFTDYYGGPCYAPDNKFIKSGLFKLLELTGFVFNEDDRKLADGTHELYLED